MLVALVALLFFLADLKYKQYVNQQSINKQVLSLQQQANDLEKQNSDLNNSLQYLSSPDFKEQVARVQLNYKRQGETVFGFTDQQTAAQKANGSSAGASNLQKWWNYFFTD